MNTYNNTMFESIKNALTKKDGNGAKFKDILKLAVGNTYTVRLLPNIKNPDKTFLPYITFGWKSFATGQLNIVNSPSSFGQKCPISEARYKVFVGGTEAEKEKYKALRRSQQWLIKAYIINDPVTPDNNGKVKVLRFGSQLHKIIMEAMEGEDAETFGARIFDLGPNGCNFKIKVEKQGEYPSYTSSKFQFPKEIEGLSPSNYQQIYDDTIDMESLVPIKSYDELKQLFNQHFLCVDVTTETKVSSKAPVQTEKVSTKTISNIPDEISSDEIDKLIEGINA